MSDYRLGSYTDQRRLHGQNGRYQGSGSAYPGGSRGNGYPGNGYPGGGPGYDPGYDPRRNNRKKKGSPVVTFFITVLLVIAIGVFAFAGWKLWGYYSEYKQGSDEYSNLNDEYVDDSGVDDENAKIPAITGETSKAGVILKSVEELEDPDTVETVKDGAKTGKAMENGTEKELPILVNPVNFTELQSINSDIMGWLRIGALDISYPVAQGSDNDFYLHRTFEKQEVFSGCIFLNCENTKYLTDQNSIVYGHNMKDGSMFGTLSRFQDQNVYDSNPYFWIYTKDFMYQYRIFSCSTVSAVGDPYRIRFATTDFESFLNTCVNASYVDNHGVKVSSDDRIVTLSTCTGDDSTRFIVQGVLEQVYASATK